MIIKTVDKENRTTTGKLVDCKDDFFGFISKRVNNNSKFFKIKDEKYNDLTLNESYTATIKCHESDEFDEEYGKQLVKFRTLDKYYVGFDGKLRDVIIDCLCLAAHLLDYVASKIGEDLYDDIIVKVAEKTGYVITHEDELDFNIDDIK